MLDPGTQALLAGQPVVYLETGFAAAAKRVGLDRPRPLLIGNPRGQLKSCSTSGCRSTSGSPRSP